MIHNPDGHILNQRANGNNFDLNRDFLTQSQSETKASVSRSRSGYAPELLDQHGYVTPTLVEATTKPHNPASTTTSGSSGTRRASTRTRRR